MTSCEVSVFSVTMAEDMSLLRKVDLKMTETMGIGEFGLGEKRFVHKINIARLK